MRYKLLIIVLYLVSLPIIIHAQAEFAALPLAEKITWLEKPANFNHPEYTNRLLQYAPLKDYKELWFEYLNKIDINSENENIFFRYLNEIDDTSSSNQNIADKFLTHKKTIKGDSINIANRFLSSKINGNFDISSSNSEYLGDWKLKNGNIELNLNDNQFSGARIKSLSEGGFEISPKQAIKIGENVYKVPLSSQFKLNNDFSVNVPKDSEILPNQGGKIIVRDLDESIIKINNEIQVRNGYIDYINDNKVLSGRDFNIYFKNSRYSGNYIAFEGDAFTLQGEASISIRNRDGLYNTFIGNDQKYGWESQDSITIKPFGPSEKDNTPYLFSEHDITINDKKQTIKYKYISDGKDFYVRPGTSIGKLGEIADSFKLNDVKLPGIIVDTKNQLRLDSDGLFIKQVNHFLGNEPKYVHHKFILDDITKLKTIQMRGTQLTNGGVMTLNTDITFTENGFIPSDLDLELQRGRNIMTVPSSIQDKIISDAIRNNALKIEMKFDLENLFARFGDGRLRSSLLGLINEMRISETDLSVFKKALEEFGFGKTLRIEGMEIFIDNKKVGVLSDTESFKRLVIDSLNR
ncbi:hypothetical protein HYX15_00260 [Candidatus Woesearchaeota archaeon]|nr:hypothetical protein [Candidatus Woesearchaeota archaeon]